MTISHLVALDSTIGYSYLHVNSKVRRASLVIYTIPMLKTRREQCNYEKICFCEGAVICIPTWCKLSSLPIPSSANFNIQYLATLMFFLVVSDSLLRSEGCGLVRDKREYSLWVSGLLVNPRRGHLKSTMKYLLVKENVLTRASCWNYISSLLEWKSRITCLLVLYRLWRAASNC